MFKKKNFFDPKSQTRSLVWSPTNLKNFGWFDDKYKAETSETIRNTTKNMNSVTSASPPTTTLCSSIQSKTQASFFGNSLSSVPVIPRTLTCSSNLKLNGLGFFGGAKSPRRIPLQCNSTTKPGPPSGSGNNPNLNLFFLILFIVSNTKWWIDKMVSCWIYVMDLFLWEKFFWWGVFSFSFSIKILNLFDSKLSPIWNVVY